MRWTCFSVVCLMCCRILVGQPTSQPSVTDIKSDFASQRYQEVLRKSAAALQPRQGLVGAERIAVLELKAESHIRLKQYTPAAETFLLAAKETPEGSKPAAMYQATSRLLRSLNPAGQYVPKTIGSGSRPTPILVVERDDRDRALLAYYDDERRAVDASIERLRQQPALPAINNTIKTINDLSVLETAAVGTDASSKLLLSQLSTAAVELLSVPLAKLQERIEHVERLASKDRTMAQTVTPNGVRQEVSQKVGLTANERAEMQGIVRDLNTIVTTSEELGKKLGVSLEPPSGSRSSRRERTLQVVNAEAREQLDAAMKVLDANYVSTPVNATRGRSSRPASGN